MAPDVVRMMSDGDGLLTMRSCAGNAGKSVPRSTRMMKNPHLLITRAAEKSSAHVRDSLRLITPHPSLQLRPQKNHWT